MISITQLINYFKNKIICLIYNDFHQIILFKYLYLFKILCIFLTLFIFDINIISYKTHFF